MKIFDFFRKYMGKMVGAGAGIFDKLEPEPKFLTSWSRSRTKMDRLRNTACKSKYNSIADPGCFILGPDKKNFSSRILNKKKRAKLDLPFLWTRGKGTGR
jgi:hypothetical protein